MGEVENAAAEQAEREAKLKKVEAWLINVAEQQMAGHGVAGEITEPKNVDALLDVFHDLDPVTQKLIGAAWPNLVYVLRKETKGGIDLAKVT